MYTLSFVGVENYFEFINIQSFIHQIFWNFIKSILNLHIDAICKVVLCGLLQNGIPTSDGIY